MFLTVEDITVEKCNRALRPSNTGSIFFQLVESTFSNMKILVARGGGSTGNKQLQLAMQHCCATS